MFDELLTRGLGALPPADDTVAAVSPWRTAFTRVLAGFALCAVTLDFLLLDWLLPAVGTVLMLLGFRALRRENRAFAVCWVLSVLRAVQFLAGAALSATVYRGMANGALLSLASAAPLLAQLLCLRAGVAAVQQKAGAPRDTRACTLLVVWYAAVLALYFLGLRTGLTLLFGGMVIAYFFILRSLYRAFSSLDEAGWAVEPAPVRLSDGALAALLAAVLALALALAYLFGAKYPMHWASPPPRAPEASAVSAELESLGFPADVLADLTDEDILACSGAELVLVDRFDSDNNPGYGTLSAAVTQIGVLHHEPDGREVWRVVQHLRYPDGARFPGTEALRLWQGSAQGWTLDWRSVSGCARYAGLAAPFHTLGRKSYTSESVFFAAEQRADVIGTFSFPRRAPSCRAYVAYTMKQNVPGSILDCWIDLVHQTSWAQFPVRTADERFGLWLSDSPFDRLQTAFQCYTGADGVPALLK